LINKTPGKHFSSTDQQDQLTAGLEAKWRGKDSYGEEVIDGYGEEVIDGYGDGIIMVNMNYQQTEYSST